jgi:hypothetical protein
MTPGPAGDGHGRSAPRGWPARDPGGRGGLGLRARAAAGRGPPSSLVAWRRGGGGGVGGRGAPLCPPRPPRGRRTVGRARSPGLPVRASRGAPEGPATGTPGPGATGVPPRHPRFRRRRHPGPRGHGRAAQASAFSPPPAPRPPGPRACRPGIRVFAATGTPAPGATGVPPRHPRFRRHRHPGPRGRGRAAHDHPPSRRLTFAWAGRYAPPVSDRAPLTGNSL